MSHPVTCSIAADVNCEYLDARCKCFACGRTNICKRCSAIILWFRFGRRRVCTLCREERDQP